MQLFRLLMRHITEIHYIPFLQFTICFYAKFIGESRHTADTKQFPISLLTSTYVQKMTLLSVGHGSFISEFHTEYKISDIHLLVFNTHREQFYVRMRYMKVDVASQLVEIIKLFLSSNRLQTLRPSHVKSLGTEDRMQNLSCHKNALNCFSSAFTFFPVTDLVAATPIMADNSPLILQTKK